MIDFMTFFMMMSGDDSGQNSQKIMSSDKNLWHYKALQQ